jgi:hypothetical protein
MGKVYGKLKGVEGNFCYEILSFSVKMRLVDFRHVGLLENFVIFTVKSHNIELFNIVAFHAKNNKIIQQANVPKINKMTENLKFSNENKIRVHFIHQSI